MLYPQHRPGTQPVQAAARRLWCLHTGAPERPVRKSLFVYHAVTEHGVKARDLRGIPALALLANEWWGLGIGSPRALGGISSAWPCTPSCTCA